MNNKNYGARGANIVPSARRSIHSLRYSLFYNTELMGRYGLNRDTEDAGSSHRNLGEDVVDNILSKPERQSTPVIKKRQTTPRRSSATPIPVYDEVSFDCNALAKSLPASLPSYSHYSDLFGGHSNELNFSGNSSPYYTSSNANEVSDDSYENHETAEDLNEVNDTNEVNKSSSQLYLVALIGVLVIVGAMYSDIFNTVVNSNNYDEYKFYNDIGDLGIRYKISDDSIMKVQTGISTIYEKQDTGSFIFLYHSKNRNFNNEKFDDFVDGVAFAAAKYLRNESLSVQHLTLDSSSLDMETPNELISRYREVVDETGVMLVRDIDRVPSSLAMAFHFYCDEYDPLVKKSAIFFTLNLATCYVQTGEKINISHIETCLKQKWNTVPEDNIRPLLARVINVVVDVTDEF